MIEINPRLESSKMWTLLPKGCTSQIKKVFLERFKKEIPQKKLDLFVEGQIYPKEILLRFSFTRKNYLKQSNFEASVEYDVQKENLISLIDLAIPSIVSMMEEFFSKGDLDLPLSWQASYIEKKEVFIKYNTMNTALEEETNKILGIKAQNSTLVRKRSQKNQSIFRSPFFALILLLFSFYSQSCGIRSIPMANNEVEASWSEVQNQYKRRSDLIPNLVKTVKAYAQHERETLEAVVKARAQATKTSFNFNQLNPAALKKFQAAQSGLSQALSRLMVVVEKYPDLKASQNFRDLQIQLEGTENRISIARRRYIESIKKFNNFITAPPESWTNALFLKYEKKPQFAVENFEEIKEVPEVDFK